MLAGFGRLDAKKRLKIPIKSAASPLDMGVKSYKINSDFDACLMPVKLARTSHQACCATSAWAHANAEAQAH